MFILPAYDPTAIAMLRFRDLAAAAFAFDFDRLANFLKIHHDDTRDRFFRRQAQVCAPLGGGRDDRRLAKRLSC